ncbi:hypothetical protein ACFWQK_09045 [Brachybacterium paraconglomeratum]
MTVSTPALARPSVGMMLLRDGTTAVAVSAGPHRILVRAAHLDAFLTDLEEIEEELNA